MKRISKTGFIVGITAATALVIASYSAKADVVAKDLGDRGDGYTLIQLSYSGSGINTGTWTVPDGVLSLQVLVVGGGGAGAMGGAFGTPGSGGGSPGGGAGGVYYTPNLSFTTGESFSLAIGTGGATTTVTGDGASGGNSVFGSIIAYGGQGGQYLANQGGNQGGYSTNSGANVTAGFLGGTGSGACGGAGASQNGHNGQYAPSYGGAGVAATITGTIGVVDANGNPMTSYSHTSGSTTLGGYPIIGLAGGGAAGYDGTGLGATYGEGYGGGSGSWPEGIPGSPGLDLTGGGGGGGRSANGGAGGSGVIYIAYQAAAIPEPSTWLLVGLGLVPLFFRRSRK